MRISTPFSGTEKEHRLIGRTEGPDRQAQKEMAESSEKKHLEQPKDILERAKGASEKADGFLGKVRLPLDRATSHPSQKQSDAGDAIKKTFEDIFNKSGGKRRETPAPGLLTPPGSFENPGKAENLPYDYRNRGAELPRTLPYKMGPDFLGDMQRGELQKAPDAVRGAIEQAARGNAPAARPSETKPNPEREKALNDMGKGIEEVKKADSAEKVLDGLMKFMEAMGKFIQGMLKAQESAKTSQEKTDRQGEGKSREKQKSAASLEETLEKKLDPGQGTEEIVQALKESLKQNGFPSDGVSIKTIDGIVVISGKGLSKEVRRALTNAAKAVPGVVIIDHNNELFITPSQERKTELTVRYQALLDEAMKQGGDLGHALNAMLVKTTAEAARTPGNRELQIRMHDLETCVDEVGVSSRFLGTYFDRFKTQLKTLYPNHSPEPRVTLAAGEKGLVLLMENIPDDLRVLTPLNLLRGSYVIVELQELGELTKDLWEIASRNNPRGNEAAQEKESGVVRSALTPPENASESLKKFANTFEGFISGHVRAQPLVNDSKAYLEAIPLIYDLNVEFSKLSNEDKKVVGKILMPRAEERLSSTITILKFDEVNGFRIDVRKDKAPAPEEPGVEAPKGVEKVTGLKDSMGWGEVNTFNVPDKAAVKLNGLINIPEQCNNLVTDGVKINRRGSNVEITILPGTEKGPSFSINGQTYDVMLVMPTSEQKSEFRLREAEERIRMIMGREETTIKTIEDNRRSGGWFMGFKKFVTGYDVHEIDISNSRQKLSTARDVALPLIEKARNEKDPAKRAEILNSARRLGGLREVDRDFDVDDTKAPVSRGLNRVDMSTERYDVEQQTIAAAQKVAEFMLDATGAVITLGGSILAKKLLQEAAKQGLKTGVNYATKEGFMLLAKQVGNDSAKQIVQKAITETGKEVTEETAKIACKQAAIKLGATLAKEGGKEIVTGQIKEAAKKIGNEEIKEDSFLSGKRTIEAAQKKRQA